MRTLIQLDLNAYLAAVIAEAAMHTSTPESPLPASNQEIRPQAVWVREPQLGRWIWTPLLPEADESPQRLATARQWWQSFVPKHLMLAFELSEQARLQNGAAKLLCTQLVPPPQFGEAAYIEDEAEGGWWEYSLAALEPDARGIWQKMSDILKAIVAPAAWWPYDDLLSLCATAEGYEELRAHVRAEMLAASGTAARKALQPQLKQLNRARQQAEALIRMHRRHQEEPEAYQEQVEAFMSQAQLLAERYLDAHQRQKTSGADTGKVIHDATLSLLRMDSTVRPEAGGARGKGGKGMLPAVAAILPAEHLEAPAYDEDRAIREATLAGDQAWIQENEVFRFLPSTDDLAVYFGDPKHPMAIKDALKRLPLLGESTALTARIALSLWNRRRLEGRLSKNGDAPVRYDEIALLRGQQKQMRNAGPGKKHSDGFRHRAMQQIKQDLDLLQTHYLKGHHLVRVGAKMIPVRVDGPYLRVGPVTAELGWGDADVGVFLSPGPWINTYSEYNNWIFAEIDEAIFQLPPQNGTHQIRLALYLVERWRQQAPRQAYDEPIAMQDLLAASVIAVDRKHLTDRFIPRIEHAIQDLCERKIIGSFHWLTPVKKEKPQWGNDWLGALVQVLPPDELIRSYASRLENPRRRTLPPGSTEETLNQD